MKLMLHELRAAIADVAKLELSDAFKKTRTRQQNHGTTGLRLGRAGHDDAA